MSSLYYYELLSPSGRLSRGLADLAARARPDVEQALEAMQPGSMVIRAVYLCSTESPVARVVQALSEGSVARGEVAGVLRDVAVMVQCGVPVFEAVRDVRTDRQQEGSRAIQAVCTRLENDLLAGASVGTALARQPKVFSDTVRNLVAIGDETGNVGRMLGEAASHMERIATLKAATVQSLIYPAISILSVLAAAGFWIVYVMPNLGDMFKQFNLKLPELTLVVLAGSKWLAAYWFWVLVGVLAGLAGLQLAWRRSETFKLQVYRLLYRVPIVKRLVSTSSLAMFCEYLAILLRSGVDVMRSLRILEAATVDRHIRDRMGMVRQAVERGDQLAHAMRVSRGFPVLMVRMIEVGERSGTMDDQLSFLSKQYSERLDRLLGNLSEIIKPLVIMLVGGIFAVLIMALMLPVYELIKQSVGGMR